MTRHQPLNSEELEQRLESLVYPVLTVRRSVARPAQELGRYDRSVQERFLASVALITKTSHELGYNFCAFAPPSLALVDAEEWPDWVEHIADTYDSRGVLACISALQKVPDYVARRRASRAGLSFQEVIRVLEPFVLGLNGRALKLQAAAEHYTDTEALFLPESLARFDSRETNYRLYKAYAVHQWAQTWYGTWRADLLEVTAKFPAPGRALRLFHILETLRLDACIARELPGIHREMQELRARSEAAALAGPWRDAAERLGRLGRTVEHSVHLLGELYERPDPPAPVCYQGALFPERTAQVRELRLERDRDALQAQLAILADEHLRQAAATHEPADGEGPHFDVVAKPDTDWPEGSRTVLRMEGEPLPPQHEGQQLVDSIVQDLGAIPPEYLVPAGPGRYRAAEGAAGGTAPAAESDHGYVYDEWDYTRKHYRKDWCLLRERDVHPRLDDFVARTLARHRGLRKHLYRTFEALRGEERRLKRQPHGDDLDLDALVESLADQRVGLEASDRVFTRLQRVDRNIAVMFMVDMSGSTKGWINDVMREALVLLCESLELLGDRYAIYGFSGFTHKRCELFRIKRFEERYGEEVESRVSGIRPQDYTRMGVAIRHLSAQLAAVEARTKLLITLSDGRPDDHDGYRGVYGIEDTRQALIEAKHAGIHSFCITIDDEAMEYLPHMYGPANFTVVSQLHQLPYRVSDIYRRITM